MNKVSVIIAAKNEGPRIGAVLDVLVKHPLVDEVIVMCNDCTDDTANVARSYNIRVYEDPQAIGKTMAIKKGLSLAKKDTIFLIDADLRDLSAEDITNLIMPVLTDQVDCTISLWENSTFIYKLLSIDHMSGGRVIKKDLLGDAAIWSKSHLSYSLEVLMNRSLLSRKKTFVSVRTDMHNTRKKEKTNFIRGNIEEVSMMSNIFKVIPIYEFFWQLFKMAYLNKRYQDILETKGI